MDNDHGITDELREWAKTLTHWWYDPVKNEYTYTSGTMPPSIDAIRLDSNILAIADRIDAAHERLCSRSRSNGYNDGFTDGFNDIEYWVIDHEDEMAEHGYVRLPKDANGEVIHLGDVVMLPDWPLNHHEVINLVYARDGWAIISRHGSIEASEHTVHVKPKKPTVEEVLRDMLADVLPYATSVDDHEATDAIAEYAKKLRLKED